MGATNTNSDQSPLTGDSDEWGEPTVVEECVSLVGRAATKQRLAAPREQTIDVPRARAIDEIFLHDTSAQEVCP